VKDQGSGMLDAAIGAIADHVQSLGLGILGMRQRLRQFGGQLEIKTSHHGTEIIATVPLTSAPTGQRTRGSVREDDNGEYPTGGRSRDHAARVAWSP
jgi:signal transduction histidine kinase